MPPDYYQLVFDHYKTCWLAEPHTYLWDKGPIEQLPFNFRVLEFASTPVRKMWTYATCGMSDLDCANPIELHLFSSVKEETIIELLTAAAHYHSKKASFDLNHTLNFGRPWQEKSHCEYGLISLPYLDGPNLENMEIGDRIVKFYWLIPITKEEVEYKRKYGAEALEQCFETAAFNYIDPQRKAVI